MAYVPGLSRNLLSTFKAVRQGKKAFIYCRTKAFLGLLGEKSLVFKFCPRKGLFSAIGVGQIPIQVVALGASIAETWSARAGAWATLPVAAKARNIMEVHRMLVHPSEGITWKTAEAMRIATTGQWGSCEACL